MNEQLRPEDTFGGIRINDRTLSKLRSKFPKIKVTPKTTPEEMYFNGGQENVLDYLEALVRREKSL